ncbi:MAG: hypothetical protein SF069_04665 [Phycisphaerae bacterium]|nr:hypothetical protein [Phycisphaerae bacterium]
MTTNPNNPDPAEIPAPRAADILAWARRFLPHYFTEDPAPFHAELFHDLADPQRRCIARAAPRGHAKSTCAALAYPLWAICEQQRKNIVIITHESTLARQFVSDIRRELESNDLLRAAYGDLCSESRVCEAAPTDLTPPQTPTAAQRTSSPTADPAPKSNRRVGRAAPKTVRSPKTPTAAKPTSSRPTPKRPARRKTPRPNAPSTNPAASADPSAFCIEHSALKGRVGRAAPKTMTSPQTPTAAKPTKRRWTSTHFTTNTGITVQAKGAAAGFRGARSGPHRPDLIICDDLEKDELVSSSEQRTKLERWLRRVVMPALAPDGRLVVLGSILHHDSLLANLANPERFPGWHYKLYRAVEVRQTPQGEFQRVPLWPARWPLEKLDEERRRIGTIAFEQEYQANPVDDGLRVFRPEWLRRYDPAELQDKKLTHLIAVDPATGKTNGDFFALWVGGLDPATGTIYTRVLELSRIGIVAQVRRILAAFEEWRPVKIGIETIAYQAALKEILEDESRRRGMYMPIVSIQHTADKAARIEASSLFFENGLFRLPPKLDTEAELQFLQFPKHRHDDAPDVCAMAIDLARSLRTSRISGMTPSMNPHRNGHDSRYW